MYHGMLKSTRAITISGRFSFLFFFPTLGRSRGRQKLLVFSVKTQVLSPPSSISPIIITRYAVTTLLLVSRVKDILGPDSCCRFRMSLPHPVEGEDRWSESDSGLLRTWKTLCVVLLCCVALLCDVLGVSCPLFCCWGGGQRT